MSKINIYIDESGVFGPYQFHSQYYIVTLVIHNPSDNITENINYLNHKMDNEKFDNLNIHTGPLIRREYDYDRFSLLERKRIFNILYNFVRTIDIKYHTILVEKKQFASDIDLANRISKNLSKFLKCNLLSLLNHESVIVYYDKGQRELNNVIVSVFNSILNNVEFEKEKNSQADHKLFQAADMLCTLELLAEKIRRKSLSKSELAFFSSGKNIYKSYLRAIEHKKLM